MGRSRPLFRAIRCLTQGLGELKQYIHICFKADYGRIVRDLNKIQYIQADILGWYIQGSFQGAFMRTFLTTLVLITSLPLVASAQYTASTVGTLTRCVDYQSIKDQACRPDTASSADCQKATSMVMQYCSSVIDESGRVSQDKIREVIAATTNTTPGGTATDLYEEQCKAKQSKYNSICTNPAQNIGNDCVQMYDAYKSSCANYFDRYPITPPSPAGTTDKQQYEVCKSRVDFLNRECSTWNEWVANGSCGGAYKEFVATCAFPALTFTPPKEETGGVDKKLFEICKDKQQYLVRECSTSKDWNESKGSCKEHYAGFTNTCANFAQQLPFTPPNLTAGGTGERYQICVSKQQAYNNQCGSTPDGGAQSALSGTSDACEKLSESFRADCAEYANQLPLGTGLVVNGCRASYTQYLLMCGQSVGQNVGTNCDDRKEAYQKICAETYSEPTPPDLPPEQGGPSGIVPPVNLEISTACSAAIDRMAHACQKSVISGDCIESASKKREVCDDFHTPVYTTTYTQTGLSGGSSPAVRTTDSYCKEAYSYITQYCSGSSSTSSQCSSVRENYDRTCLGGSLATIGNSGAVTTSSGDGGSVTGGSVAGDSATGGNVAVTGGRTGCHFTTSPTGTSIVSCDSDANTTGGSTGDGSVAGSLGGAVSIGGGSTTDSGTQGGSVPAIDGTNGDNTNNANGTNPSLGGALSIAP